MIDLKIINDLLPEEIKTSNLKWKYVNNFPMYICSENGDIVSLKKTIIRYNKEEIKNPFILKHSTNNYGYEFVSLHNAGKVKFIPIHVIVGESFIKVRNKGEVIDHIDNNKLNNNVENLEWCNNSENSIHAFKLGLRK